MPESKTKPGRVISLKDSRLMSKKALEDSLARSTELFKYLTPKEVECAGEEGWYRIVAQIRGHKSR